MIPLPVFFIALLCMFALGMAFGYSLAGEPTSYDDPQPIPFDDDIADCDIAAEVDRREWSNTHWPDGIPREPKA